MATAAELAVLIKADTKGLDSGLDAAKKGLGGLGGTAGKMGLAVGAGFAAAGAAAVAGAALVGKAWFDAAGDAAQSVWDLQGTLGITAAEAEGLGDVGIEVFKNNWGGSIGEATKAVGQLKQVFGDDVLDSELQSLTEQAFALEQVFGIELVDSGRAAQAMFNNFGTEGMKAFDIIAASQQKLGPAGDDLVDTFNEYSGVFDQLGFGAEEMASSLVDAVQAGARNTDVAADAVKEFGIRIQDATYLSDAAMAVLPASMLDIKKAFEDGSVSGRDAMLAVGEEIANIEDPMRRYEAGVLAFGTKWEDMGEAAVIAMATSGGALDDMEGAAARAGEAVNQGIGAAWEQTKRTALTAMMEISGTESFELLRERVVGVLGDIQSRIGDFVTDVKSVFGDGMSEAADATALVSDSLGIMSDDIVDAQGGVSGFRDVLVDLKAKFDDVQAAFEEGGIVAALSEIVGFDIQPIIDGFIAAKDAVVDLTGFIIEHKDEIILVAGAYAGFKTGLAVTSVISSASKALGAMTGAWKLYRDGAALSTIATHLFGGAVKVALGPVGWAIMAISVAVGLLAAAWATNFGDIQGKTQAVVNWFKGLPAFFSGLWANIGDEVKAFGFILISILMPWTLLFSDTGRDMLMGMAKGIADTAGKVKDAVVNAVKGAYDGAKSFLGIKSPSRLFRDMGFWIMEGLALGIQAGGVTAAESLADALAAYHAAMADNVDLDFWRGEYAKFGAEVRDIMLSVGLSDDQNAEIAGLIDEGRFDRAMQLWNRYFDELKTAEQDRHDQYIADIEAEGEALSDSIAMAKRRIEGLQDARPGMAILDFSGEVDRIEAQFAPLLKSIGEMVGMDFTGSKALDDFYSWWTGGAVDAITNSEELLKAMDALYTYQGNANDEAIEAENERHRIVMDGWGQSEAAMRLALEEQGYAEERINEILDYRLEKLNEVKAAIKAMQAAAEEFEKRVHALVMERFEEQLKAREAAHRDAMAALEAERDAILNRFKAAETEIDHMKVALAELKVDLNIEAEVVKLGEMQKGLDLISDTIKGLRILNVDPIGQRQEAIRQQRSSIRLDQGGTELGDFQRGLVLQAMRGGELDERQMFIAERLLLGFKFNADEVLAIFAKVERDAKDQVDAQEGIVTARQREIAAMVATIEHAEHLLMIDRDRNVEVLAGLNAAIEFEKQRWESEKAHIEDLMQREKERHQQRMIDIAAEWALELARLGMSEDEIKSMIERAQALAQEIADAAAAIYASTLSEVREIFAGADPIVLPPIEYPPGFPPEPPPPPPDPSGDGTYSEGGGGAYSYDSGGTLPGTGALTIDIDMHPVVTMEPVDQYITVNTTVDSNLLDTAFERRTERLERAIRFGRGATP